ncbi:hypothetical protein LYSHEL_25570 [Lysobacter helvus]|uniref:Uncharacterized protein n=2 Tax=Lysobacteraceae TaxID=32033 RepID=A0ABN6FV56_9GAMM|nr:hypothetical protein LYSCAS_25570 [Lysobacter caseinilyticus]BCT96686.1 hypothetical protein LYSHEL_25570 [Lysobacter helvus]
MHRYVAPSRPLPPACRWLLQPDSAHLLWNAGCIAMVYTDQRAGCCQSVIQWQQVRHIARCGSIEQGMRWIDRWMEKRGGLPGSGTRRAVSLPAWARWVRHN